MSSQNFRIDEHTIEASHIRSFPRALATHENDPLRLAIKQYTPLNNPNPQDGDITIIAAHANAFPKVRQFHRQVKISLSTCWRKARPRGGSPSCVKCHNRNKHLRETNTDNSRNCMNHSGTTYSSGAKPSASRSAAYGSQT